MLILCNTKQRRQEVDIRWLRLMKALLVLPCKACPGLETGAFTKQHQQCSLFSTLRTNQQKD